MSLVLVTAPAVEPITVAEVKAHLALQTDDFNALLATYISAVREHLDGRDGILGRALVTQTWDLKLDGFCEEIEIPLPPLQSITSPINYLDSNGAAQTLTSAHYRVIGIGSGWPSKIVPAYGESWPSTYGVPECVTIRFVAGYPVEGA